MRVLRVGWLVGIAVLSQCPLGCSSSSSSGSSGPPQVRGDYRPTSDGDIKDINFYDATHYFLYRTCADGQQPPENRDGCIESGTYALNDARTELSLTNVETGQTTVLPFQSLSVDNSLTGDSFEAPAVRTESGIVNQDAGGIVQGDGGLGSGDGGIVQGDGGLESGDGGTSLATNKGPLISSFKAGKQNFGSQGQGQGQGQGTGSGSGTGTGTGTGTGSGTDPGSGTGTGTGTGSPAGTTSTGEINIQYEGTCDFLHNCSGPSRSLPAGTVLWGCTGQGACSDTEAWVSGPDRSYCSHGSATVCAAGSGRCVSAVIRDISSPSGHWEAGNGTLDAIGLSHGLTGTCSGYGGGRVTITY